MNSLKTSCFFLLLFLNSMATIGQTIRRPITIPFVGQSTYSRNQVDVFSFTKNQASLAQLKNTAAGIYAERKFLLEEMSLYQAVFVVPTSSGNFGLNIVYFGSSNNNETQIGIAYGRGVGKKINLGVQFNYNSINLLGYGKTSTINFEIGTIFHLTENFNIGLHVYNPMGGRFSKNAAEQLASVYSFGLGYDVSDKFFVTAEMEKEESQSLHINAGFQYRFLKQLMVKGGVYTNNETIYFGCAIFLKSLRVDVGASHHPQLGITPGLQLIYSFKKNEQ